MKKEASASRRSPIFYEILAYLTDHPHAQDTVTGIVEWWLLEQRIQRSARQVKAVLQQLTDENYVITRTDRAGCIYYQVNGQKLREIRRLVIREKE